MFEDLVAGIRADYAANKRKSFRRLNDSSCIFSIVQSNESGLNHHRTNQGLCLQAATRKPRMAR